MTLAQAPAVLPGTLLERGQCVLGLLVFLLVAAGIGRAYSGAGRMPWRVLGWGVALAFAFGGIVLYSPGLLAAVQAGIQHVLDYTLEGSKMVFGNLAGYAGVPVNDDGGRAIGTANTAAVFAFVVLPTIVFVSMLTAILYRLHVLGWVVSGLAWTMRRTMGTSGAETLSTAANVFVGQTEAPLIVKPFLAAATRSELMAIMVGGFANIASGVLVVYTDFLKAYVRDAGGHLAAACFVSAPMTLVIAKLIVPETATPRTADAAGGDAAAQIDANLFDAATRGTSEGLTLAINVGAMLLAFTALVALLNGVIGWGFAKAGVDGITLQGLLGYVCSPVAWLCGIPWHDCQKVGGLLGVKTVLNEFIAYSDLSRSYAADANYLSPRSGLLATYALCGFANVASVGIQIGGISVLAPERRHELARLGGVAMIGGAIASCAGACVIGVLT